ncbi:MAG: hypothetical protein N3D12_03080 [Candidatus Methanomethyliaceae archaeon]|nr:hypothetical protein [Candidatus Methanomethyliaceae archaeon]
MVVWREFIMFGMKNAGIIILIPLIIVALSAASPIIGCGEVNFKVEDVIWRNLNIGVGNSTCVVSLRYYGSEPCSYLRGTLDVSKLSENYTEVSDEYSGTLESGGVVYLEFVFDVSSSSKAGWYKVPLRVNYMTDGKIFWEAFDLVLTLNGDPDISIGSSCEVILRGHINGLPIIIKNLGDGVARKVTVTVQSQDVYLTTIGSNEFSRDFLMPNEEWSIVVNAFAQLSIRDGTSIAVNVRYEDQSEVGYTKTTTIGLKVEDPERPSMVVSTNTTRIRPGVTNGVLFSIVNDGGKKAVDLTVRLAPASNQLTLVGNNTFSVQDLSVGEVLNIPLSLYLEPQTYGSLPLYVVIDYKDERNSTYQDSLSIGFLSEEEPEPKVEVTARGVRLQPNAINSIIIILENRGDRAAKDLRINLFSQSPEVAVVVGSGVAHRDLLEPKDVWEVEKEVFVQPNVYGAVPLYVQIQYKDDLQNRYSYTSAIGFEVKGVPSVAISSVIYNPSPVFPGNRVVRANCVIVNHGNYTAQDVSIVLGKISGVVKPSYPGSDRVKIPFLTVGGSLSVQFLLDIDENAKPGYYEIPVEISTSTENISTAIPLTVSEKAKILVDKIYFDREVVPGARNVKLFIETLNIGNVTAEEVRVSVISGYITGSTTSLLGSMASGSRKVIVMEVDVDSKVSPGELPVDVEISWSQDGRGMSETSTKNLMINEPSRVDIWALLGVLVVAAVLVVIFRKKALEVGRSFLYKLRGR